MTSEEIKERDRKRTSIYNKRYREKNNDKTSELKKKWYLKNAEELRQKAKKYYHDNIDKIKEKARKYRKENRNEIKAYMREWHKKNKLANQMQTRLPINPGFYWWREFSSNSWRMVQVVDTMNDTRFLYATDIHHNSFSRSIAAWYHDGIPTGQWIKVQPPKI